MLIVHIDIMKPDYITKFDVKKNSVVIFNRCNR